MHTVQYDMPILNSLHLMHSTVRCSELIAHAGMFEYDITPCKYMNTASYATCNARYMYVKNIMHNTVHNVPHLGDDCGRGVVCILPVVG